ncbi:cathelicidin antimicrobial peptide-like isoform 1-T1 [Discoglossus pictus]
MKQLFQLFVLLGLFGILNSAPQILGTRDEIASLIQFYNKESITKYLFKLQEVEDMTGPSHPSDTYEGKKLKFIIKETLCLKSRQQNTEDCAFKDNGEVRNCTATFNGQGGRDIIISCDTLTSMNMKEETEETEKNSNVHNPQIKKRSLNLLVSNKKLSNTTTTNTVSCLQCIFDIFGTNS